MIGEYVNELDVCEDANTMTVANNKMNRWTNCDVLLGKEVNLDTILVFTGKHGARNLNRLSPYKSFNNIPFISVTSSHGRNTVMSWQHCALHF